MYKHRFQWQKRAIRMFYFIEATPHGLQLVLDDVCAATSTIVESVPDWRIELEASVVAADHNARYL
jgi:hypothetical protein